MTQEKSKYVELIQWIKEQITKNEIKPGDRFYSEGELSNMFDISRQTVRQAVGILEYEGFLERRQGSGTYIKYEGMRAKQPLTVKTKSIGVISTFLDSYIFPSIIKGIDIVLAGSGYSMQLSLTHNQVENETRALNSMIANNVDGIIVEPTKSGLPNHNFHIYEEIRSLRIPLIFFNATYPGLDFPHVSLNDKLAGKMAAQCLIDAGHKHIAGIFQMDDRQGHLRYSGYLEALNNAGIEAHASNIMWFTTEDIPFIKNDFGRVLRYIKNCTGIVCYNDQIAFLLVSELVSRGINIPDDISIIGVDDAEIAVFCETPLTTIKNPVNELGKTLAYNILKLIDNPSFDATVDFEPQLIERSSIKRLIADES